MRLSTETRQAEIIDATLKLAAGISPALITTNDIAKYVGVSQGALFKHFPTKEAIWLAAMEWVSTNLLATLQASAQAASSPMAALRAVFFAHIDFVIANPGVPRVIFHELQQPADSLTKQTVRTLLQSYRRMLLGLLCEAERQGAVPSALNRDAAVSLFVGIVQGLVMQSMLAGQPSAMRPQAEEVFAIYLQGLGGSTP